MPIEAAVLARSMIGIAAIDLTPPPFGLPPSWAPRAALPLSSPNAGSRSSARSSDSPPAGRTALGSWSNPAPGPRNVAEAIATAALHPAARNAVFNVGEETTPTMSERLALLPKRPGEPPAPPSFDFGQDLMISTFRICRELGYLDAVDEWSAMIASASQHSE